MEGWLDYYNMITQEFLKNLFLYDENTGIFTRKISRNRFTKNSPVGCVREQGWIIISINHRKYQAHRLAWIYYYGIIPQGIIEHINGNRSDNRIENLRNVIDKRLVSCAMCQKEIRKSLSKLTRSKSGFYFCGRICKDNAQKLGGIKEIQPKHFGTSKKNYKRLAFSNNLSKCTRCNYSKCRGALEVHHIDRNRENNTLENLEILCRNCHAEEHYFNKEHI